MSELILGIVYCFFDDYYGPIPLIWDPQSISKEFMEQIANSTLAFDPSNGKTPGQLSIIAFPIEKCKTLTKYIRYEDKELRGGQGFGTINILFKEENDLIFYKYIKQFESYVDNLASEFILLNENHVTHEDLSNCIIEFYKQLNAFIEKLKHQELASRKFIETEVAGTYKIVICGDPSVGKTSLILRFTDEAFKREYIATIGVNISEKIIHFNKLDQEILFVFWDIAGQSKFTIFRQKYYHGAAGFIIVCDISDRSSFETIPDWCSDIRKKNPNLPGIIVGNKKDLEEFRKVSFEELLELGKKLGLQVVEVSALTGENVVETFTSFGRNLLILDKN